MKFQKLEVAEEAGAGLPQAMSALTLGWGGEGWGRGPRGNVGAEQEVVGFPP